MKLNALYDIADNDGVIVECYDFTHSPSVSVLNDGVCYIGINPLMLNTSADEKVKLAHELGHCETGAFYNMYSPLDIRAKHEHRADKWAIKKLIPEDELKQACKSCHNRFELAEYFGVTEDFMQKALDYYKQ